MGEVAVVRGLLACEPFRGIKYLKRRSYPLGSGEIPIGWVSRLYKVHKANELKKEAIEQPR